MLTAAPLSSLSLPLLGTLLPPRPALGSSKFRIRGRTGLRQEGPHEVGACVRMCAIAEQISGRASWSTCALVEISDSTWAFTGLRASPRFPDPPDFEFSVNRKGGRRNQDREWLVCRDPQPFRFHIHTACKHDLARDGSGGGAAAAAARHRTQDHACRERVRLCGIAGQQHRRTVRSQATASASPVAPSLSKSSRASRALREARKKGGHVVIGA